MATLDEIRAQGLANLIKAGEKLTAAPTPLPTQQVTPLSALEQQAGNVAATSVATRPDFLGAGAGALQRAETSALAGAGAFDPQSYQAFMSPYQQDVIDRYTQEMQRQFNISQQGLAAKALGSGAFGGAREGVAQAEALRGFQDKLGQGVAGLLQSGFQQAQQQAQTAFEAQQQRAQKAGQLQSGIGQLYGQFAPTAAQTTAADVETLAKIGASQRGVEQAASDVQFQNLLRQYQQPFQNLQFQSGLVGGFPTQQQQPTSQGNPLLTGIASLFNQAGGLFG